MKKYKVRFVVESKEEEPVTGDYTLTVHQYMKILEQVKKIKGVR